MNAYVNETSSPLGPISFAVNEEREVLGVWFRNGRRPHAIERELRNEGFELVRDSDESFTAFVRKQLSEYFTGERRTFDLDIVYRGSNFERAVWRELSSIPFGQTRTYGQVAEAVGSAGEIGTAVDVGKACAANPVLLVVPCHRVVSADGSLKGYAAGLPIKAGLLDLEGDQSPLFAR